MIFFCRKCLTPNTRPRIVFNKKKICNACVNAKQKLVVNWKTRKKHSMKTLNSLPKRISKLSGTNQKLDAEKKKKKHQKMTPTLSQKGS